MPELTHDLINTILVFVCVGFLAQLVDGALGMAYGVVSTTVLLSVGVPPATASASVHMAEVFTTAASGVSHIAHRNVDWKAFALLAPAGVIGGALGAYVLTGIDGDAIQPLIVTYLGVMGLYIFIRGFKVFPAKPIASRFTPPLGLVGGFLDAVGGGGWGPTVSSSLLGAGGAPRYVIGTVNTAEFLVTIAISATFIFTLVSGRWDSGDALHEHAAAVAGLILGGLLAAPIAGYVVKIAKPRVLTLAVGVLIMALALYQGARLVGVI